MRLTEQSLREQGQQHKQYVSCPELNDVLYLSHKGIERIEALQVRESMCSSLYLVHCSYIRSGPHMPVPTRCMCVCAPLVCLQPCTGLRTLYLESNAISRIEGLDTLVNLRALYLGKNLIDSLAGLQKLTQLETLDVSHNRLSSCSGLSALVNLRSANLSCNRLSSASDLSELCACTQLVTLDLSGNRLEAQGVLQLLTEAPWQLALLRLQGNPLAGQLE
jgi:Leucine-rich repeat (LRR) protein